MSWDSSLTPGSQAHSIAASSKARIRVVAGPRTGKSFAMKCRVARLWKVESLLRRYCQSHSHGLPPRTFIGNSLEWVCQVATSCKALRCIASH